MIQCVPVNVLCEVVLDVLELAMWCIVVAACSDVVSCSGMMSSGSCRFGLFLCFGSLVNQCLIVS